MFNVRLLAVLPFLAITTVANAGATISDTRYWPSLAHPSASLNSDAQAGTQVVHQTREDRTKASQALTYRGGPKAGVWSRRSSNDAVEHICFGLVPGAR